jgi:dynactin 1
MIRMQAQFDHLAETYFGGFDFDLGERELGYALSFDHDLDMFAASLGLVKTSIGAVVKEEGNCVSHWACLSNADVR